MELNARIERPSVYAAFEGQRCIATGDLKHVIRETKKVVDADPKGPILVFDADTSELVDVDFRGTADEVVTRLGLTSDTAGDPLAKRGPGRPRLGVTAREVTLLPRHWEWLDEQPGGPSVALRKLVEMAKRTNKDKDRVRRAQESVHRFMWAMAGDLPGFEEASRAFYAGDPGRFIEIVQAWPADIRDHLLKLASAADQAAAVAA